MATGQPLDVLLDCDERLLLTLAEVHGEQWSRLEHLVADLIEVVDASGLRSISVGLKQSDRKKLPKPVEVPRPGARRKRRKGTTMGQLIRMTGAAPQHVPRGGGDADRR